MKDTNARLRKLNSKLITILNRSHLYKMANELRKENKINQFKE